MNERKTSSFVVIGDSVIRGVYTRSKFWNQTVKNKIMDDEKIRKIGIHIGILTKSHFNDSLKKRRYAMKKKVFYGTLFIIIGFLLINFQNLEAQEQKILTVEDVEKVTGMQNLKRVPKNPDENIIGDFNFAQQDDNLVLMGHIQEVSLYETWKNQKGLFHSKIDGLGDEAFIGPKTGEVRYILVFKKGDKSVSLSSYLKSENEAFVSEDELRELANIIISRL
ncbi:hypothetical protein KGY73_09780 [bacterium]|nr:hypothetical protein [bacterium]